MPVKKPILIVEDEVNLRRSLALILERAGFTVITACDYQEAISQLHENEFSLFLIDLRLPKVSRLDLFFKLHRLCPEIPVLILSASEPPRVVEVDGQTLQLDYLLKPTDPGLLLDRVQSLLI